MHKWICLVLLFLPFFCVAQSTITGKVINLSDKKPITNASVFLSNATIGTATVADGSFTLNNVHNGQYDLVVSIVGYETYHQTIFVNKPVIALPPVELFAKVIALKEVKIGPDLNWDRYYQIFKRSFIGASANAEKCTIINPDLLDFGYDSNTHILQASTSDFIIVENKALGYRIKYLLAKYNNDPNEGMVFFEGSVLFEELKGSPAQIHRWEKKRLDAYLGSPMHFLRSILGNQVTEEGFKVLTLIKKPNPEYTTGPNNRYLLTLVNKPLMINEYAKLTDQKDLYALATKDCLYVMYTNKRDMNVGAMVGQFHMPDFVSSIVSFNQPYALFDKNGVIVDPAALTFEGSWTRDLIAELLPVDYEPIVK